MQIESNEFKVQSHEPV